MDISFEKWIVMAVLTIISIILGLIPWYIFRSVSLSLRTDATVYKIVLTILSCFGAGVLLSTLFLHVLPEVRESLVHVPSVWEIFDVRFPVAEIFLLCGFALIYLIEEIAHYILVDGHHLHNHQPNSVVRHNSIAHGIPIPNTRNRSSLALRNVDGEGLGLSPAIKNIGTPDSGADKSDNEEDECPLDKVNMASSFRTLLALFALSFHAVMEGVAIGIQTKSDVWVMFGAVASHKFVISFCMGMELNTSQTKISTYIGSIVFFAVVSPIGIIIGSLISSNTSTDSLPVAIVEGLVCGSLLYVVCFEILSRERDRKTYSMPRSRAIGFLQFISLVVGLLGMGFLTTLTHDHDHGHDGHHSGGFPKLSSALSLSSSTSSPSLDQTEGSSFMAT